MVFFQCKVALKWSYLLEMERWTVEVAENKEKGRRIP